LQYTQNATDNLIKILKDAQGIYYLEFYFG